MNLCLLRQLADKARRGAGTIFLSVGQAPPSLLLLSLASFPLSLPSHLRPLEVGPTLPSLSISFPLEVGP